MVESITSLQQEIMRSRFTGLDLGAESVDPAYDGLSILNLPSSVVRWLGAEALPHPELAIEALGSLAQGIEQVIVTLVDALSLSRFVRWSEAGGLQPYLDQGLVGALSSVCPSTTSAALTSLWTGRSPAEHGILGYELLLKEFGVVANMITHSPMASDGSPGLLYAAGFDPETFLPVEVLGRRLGRAGVQSHAYLHRRIAGSGLSRMLHAGVQLHSYYGAPDLWLGVRDLLRSKASDKRYIWVYYGGVDGISHLFGPDSEQAQAEFTTFSRNMVDHFLVPIQGQVNRPTLFILLADHGQVSTPLDPHYETRHHPDLTRLLHVMPTGESRLSYFYPKEGTVLAVQAYLEATWPDAFKTFSSQAALQAGLFGPGAPLPATSDRIGEMISVSQGGSYFWTADKPNPLLGRHGGVSPAEMLVPFFALRLDG